MDYRNYCARINLMFEKINQQQGYVDDFLVYIKYKYDFEKEYDTEFLYYQYDGNNDKYVVNTDWWEGQQDIIIAGVRSFYDAMNELNWGENNGYI